MPELVIPIREYIGESQFNWETLEMEWGTNADDVRMAVEWAGYDGIEVDSICLEIGRCFGGSTFAGFEIFNYLRGLGLPIRVRVLSLAASMGTIIALAGDVIEMEHTAQLMVHPPSMDTYGTAVEIRSDLSGLDNTQQLLTDVYMARTGQSAEVVAQWMAQDTWFTADQALAVGLCTTVLPLAPATATKPATDAQASARRAKYAGITARADKRAITARATPRPKAKTNAKLAPTASLPRPMATKKKPATAAAAKLTPAQLANNAAVLAFAKQLGVKASIEGTEVVEIAAVAEPTVLANGDGTLYTDGPLAVDAHCYNDEAMTTHTADGDYEAEDGRVITVAGGMVTAITEATAEAGEAEAAPAAASTADITAAIAAALAPMTLKMADMEAKFNKAVPPMPTPRASGASGSQVADPKAPPTPKPRGVLAGASARK